MAWSRGHFVRMLDEAIADYRDDDFVSTVLKFDPYKDIALGDDGSFQKLCEADAYVAYIYELLECWIESQNCPSAYPKLAASDWIDVAESLREDINNDRVPTDSRWNLIYTEFCNRCKAHTDLEDGRFVCPACGCEIPFNKP